MISTPKLLYNEGWVYVCIRRHAAGHSFCDLPVATWLFNLPPWATTTLLPLLPITQRVLHPFPPPASCFATDINAFQWQKSTGVLAIQ